MNTWLVIFGVLLAVIVFQNRRILKKMSDQEQQLIAAEADLKAAITEVGQRVDAKLAELAGNNPDLSSEIADIRSDIASLNSIAADKTPNATVDASSTSSGDAAAGGVSADATGSTGDGQ